MCHVQLPPCGRIGLQCYPGSEGFDQGLWGATCARCMATVPVNSTIVQDSSAGQVRSLTVALVFFILAFVALLAFVLYQRWTAHGQKAGAGATATGTTEEALIGGETAPAPSDSKRDVRWA
jgi:hypothetical protein